MERQPNVEPLANLALCLSEEQRIGLCEVKYEIESRLHEFSDYVHLAGQIRQCPAHLHRASANKISRF